MVIRFMVKTGQAESEHEWSRPLDGIQRSPPADSGRETEAYDSGAGFEGPSFISYSLPGSASPACLSSPPTTTSATREVSGNPNLHDLASPPSPAPSSPSLLTEPVAQPLQSAGSSLTHPICSVPGPVHAVASFCLECLSLPCLYSELSLNL